ncbi:hypothetical protein BDW75DRAFT_240284 [Aspergillus navahoensis]
MDIASACPTRSFSPLLTVLANLTVLGWFLGFTSITVQSILAVSAEHSILSLFFHTTSVTSTPQQVTTNQTYQPIDRAVTQVYSCPSISSALKQPESETNRIAYLSAHTSNSPNMSRPNTPRSYPAAISTSIPRDSFSSTESPSPLQSSPRRTGSSKSRASSDSRRRYDNTVYHYGRHSNYWLFGGFSVRDTVRDGVDWIRQQKKG